MAKKKRRSGRKSRRTMLDAAKSSAVQVQKVAMRAATEAATAAAEAAVRAVISSLSRESATRGQRPAGKRKNAHRLRPAREDSRVRREPFGRISEPRAGFFTTSV
jgi:hypothetical protein